MFAFQLEELWESGEEVRYTGQTGQAAAMVWDKNSNTGWEEVEGIVVGIAVGVVVVVDMKRTAARCTPTRKDIEDLVVKPLVESPQGFCDAYQPSLRRVYYRDRCFINVFCFGVTK